MIIKTAPIKCPIAGHEVGAVSSYDDGTVLLKVRDQSVSLEDKAKIQELIRVLQDASDRH